MIAYIILYGIIFHEYHYIRISVLTDPSFNVYDILKGIITVEGGLNTLPFLGLGNVFQILKIKGFIESILREIMEVRTP